MLCEIFKIISLMFVVTPIVKAKSHFKYRVIDGEDDVKNEFPFVVSIQSDESPLPDVELHRIGTGTLIAPQWVLTAAHNLIIDAKSVRYGNMTIPRNATKSISKVLKMIPHPSFKKGRSPNLHLINDIGLILISEIQMLFIGKLSSIDYQTMTGLKVRYAGFGITGVNLTMLEFMPLQLGEGMVTKCLLDKYYLGPEMCFVPKCTARQQDFAGGDSGGPVFLNGKIVAVIIAKRNIPQRQSVATPVSPYFDWMRGTMLKQYQIEDHAKEFVV